MSIKKKPLKSKPICRVTFELPKDTAPGEKVFVVGDFNEWNRTAQQLKAKKNGTIGCTVDLEKGKEYQFRYLIGEDRWENDPDADATVPSPFGTPNSVISA